MQTDLVSLRVLIVTPAPSLRTQLRLAAGQASVPAEVSDAEGAAAAQSLIAKGCDLILMDGGMPAAERQAICQAARAAAEPAFVITVGKADGAEADGCVRKPAGEDDAQKIVDDCIRSRLPTRVLIVDDSPTMRGIVRKILSASKFPLEVADAADGGKALEVVRAEGFDLVFLDCNMPGLDGFDILMEMRQINPRMAVVMMTATDNAAVADRARMAGAAFLKKPFFPADIDAVLYGHYKIDAPRAS